MGSRKEDWLTLKELIKVLYPLYEVTKEISADKYVTASKIIPFARILQASVTRVQDHHTGTENVKDLLRDSMMKRFSSYGGKCSHSHGSLVGSKV